MKHSIVVGFLSIFLMLEASAQGPTGFGALKIGMTKEVVESLQATDGVHLASPMSPYQHRREPPKEGVEKFIAQVASPFRTEPIEAVLTFEAAQLAEIYMALTNSPNTFDRIKDQVVEKYGAGKVEDRMKEEQCIYKNGANFKITAGAVSVSWNDDSTPAGRIETKFSDIVIADCPSNLREKPIGPFKQKSFSIRKANIPADIKQKNIF